MKIFFSGIGGIGMSAIAQIFQAKGHEVSGSDTSLSDITKNLEQKGISISGEQVSKNIDESYDLLIYSEAIPETNSERMKANELGVKQINYAEGLGMLSHDKKTIAITGTHGKTTVTGMLTSILLVAQTDPTIVIGSKIDHLDNSNFRVGQSDLFLTEACEYRDNFHHLSPDIMLINNLEPDHLDYFKTEENYYKSYQTLIEKIPETGTLILFEEDEKKLKVKNIKAKIKIISDEQCGVCPYVLSVPGQHNKQNAFAAAEVAKTLGITDDFIRRGLEDFHGTWRRFEYKGLLNGAKVYDDYGHHPTEIKATLQGAREWFPDKKLILIFQPHQYSRTRALFSEFSQSFTDANEVWITDIYKTRDSEEDIAATSAEQLAEAVSDTDAKYIPFIQLASEITKTADPNTVYLVMGAGNINKLFDELVYEGN
jgi:UDP-N-acetylmuramate--alanine ligase